MSYTPGPWEAECVDPDLEPPEWAGFAGREPVFYGASEADARLLVVAPDLLEALERLAGYVNEEHPPEDCECGISNGMDLARAAINKARGTE